MFICWNLLIPDQEIDCKNRAPYGAGGFADGSQNGSLSDGAIVGIVIGVVGLIAILILVLMFIISRRRKARAKDKQLDVANLDRLSLQIQERAAKEEPYRRKGASQIIPILCFIILLNFDKNVFQIAMATLFIHNM